MGLKERIMNKKQNTKQTKYKLLHQARSEKPYQKHNKEATKENTSPPSEARFLPLILFVPSTNNNTHTNETHKREKTSNKNNQERYQTHNYEQSTSHGHLFCFFFVVRLLFVTFSWISRVCSVCGLLTIGHDTNTVLVVVATVSFFVAF